MTIDEQIKVMQHYADGGAVEYKHRSWDEWSSKEEPTWDWASFQYRIKEEEKSLEDEIQACWNRSNRIGTSLAEIITKILDKRYTRKE